MTRISLFCINFKHAINAHTRIRSNCTDATLIFYFLLIWWFNKLPSIYLTPVWNSLSVTYLMFFFYLFVCSVSVCYFLFYDKSEEEWCFLFVFMCVCVCECVLLCNLFINQWYLNQFADGNVYNEMQQFKAQLKCKFYGIWKWTTTN